MKPEEIKKLITSSLDADTDTARFADQLETDSLSYDFSEDFSSRVIDKIFNVRMKATREIEFVRNMNFAFTRIALTGVAAIVILLISIFIAEGSISINSVLGISNPDVEGVVCLLTGN